MQPIVEGDKTILDKIRECIRYEDASGFGEAVIVDQSATVNDLHKMICLQCIHERTVGRISGLQDMKYACDFVKDLQMDGEEYPYLLKAAESRVNSLCSEYQNTVK
jgi:hypothetical protein